MAGTSLLALIDDIATILDDVAVMTKVATKKTAGVLGDDLALNAQQVTGVVADRELPVVWAVAKGSAINKAILVPAALGLSAFLPQAIPVLLMLGGAFLCFEGFEKVFHKLMHKKEEEDHQRLAEALSKEDVDMVALEKEKIKGAIRTDFILSAEIIVIALGSFEKGIPLFKEFLALVTLSVVMTVGVYGLVAGIVKLDDLGLSLVKKGGGQKALGEAILGFAPVLMKFLGIAGTIAMFLVGGGILVHGIPPIHHLSEDLIKQGGLVGSLAPTVIGLLTGVVAGGLCVALLTLVNKLRGKQAAH